MIFGCPNCDADCPIPDDKIKNRILKVRCKVCKHVFYVKDPSLDSAMPQTTLNAPPVPDEDEIWFYAAQQQTHGPVSKGTMRHLIETAQILSSSLVWKEGMSGWQPLESVPELTYILQEIASPTPDLENSPIAPGLDDIESQTDLPLDFSDDDAANDDDMLVDLDQEADDDLVKGLLEEEEKLQKEFEEKIAQKKREKEQKLSEPAKEQDKDPEEELIAKQLLEEEQQLKDQDKKKSLIPAEKEILEKSAEAQPTNQTTKTDASLEEEFFQQKPKTNNVVKPAKHTVEDSTKPKGSSASQSAKVEIEDFAALPPSLEDEQYAPPKKSNNKVLVAIALVSVIAISLTYAFTSNKQQPAPEYFEIDKTKNLFIPGDKLVENKMEEEPVQPQIDEDPKIEALPKKNESPKATKTKAESEAEIKAMRDAIMGVNKKEKKVRSAAAKKNNRRIVASNELPPIPPDSMEGEPLLPQTLRQDQIKFVVNRKTPRIRMCYDTQLKRNPNLTGKLVINFVIENNGKVSSVRLKTRKFKGTYLDKCVKRTIRSWRFPKFSGDPVSVDYPFIFSAF